MDKKKIEAVVSELSKAVLKAEELQDDLDKLYSVCTNLMEQLVTMQCESVRCMVRQGEIYRYTFKDHELIVRIDNITENGVHVHYVKAEDWTEETDWTKAEERTISLDSFVFCGANQLHLLEGSKQNETTEKKK